jgi:5-(carboxyamino)imidazole ribonucleotide mutase
MTKIKKKSIARKKTLPLVAVVMGSESDWPTMEHAAAVLTRFQVPYEVKVVSAHRTPKRLYEFAHGAASAGLKLIIAGAGGAAHLPGMIAAIAPLPVLGVPVESKTLDGLDSLLSIAQMPAGIPVATLAIGRAGAVNAGLLAVAILAQWDQSLAKALQAFRQQQTQAVALSPVRLVKSKPKTKPSSQKSRKRHGNGA